MQKKLITLALASAFAVPAAFAATSNVDIYGQIGYSLDYINSHDGVGDAKDWVTGRDNISRIGFKGSEDLGGGLNAIWQIESQIDPTGANGTGVNAGGALASRDSFVGLSGGFGTVLAGRHDTPYKMATASLDPFTDQLGDYNAIIGAPGTGLNAGSVGAFATGFDARAPATVAYVSPSFSGLTLAGAYIQIKLNEAAIGTPNKNTDGYSLAAMYGNGPIFASGAYERHNGGLANASVNSDTSAWKVGVGGTLGDFTAAVVYEDMSDSAGNTGFDRKAWLLNGTYTMGGIVLKGEYGQADSSDITASNDGAKFWALGGDYNFSKRTKVFAQYAKVNNDNCTGVCGGGNGGQYGFYSYTGANTAGNDLDGFSLGMRHSF